jgi:hypothetical protein
MPPKVKAKAKRPAVRNKAQKAQKKTAPIVTHKPKKRKLPMTAKDDDARREEEKKRVDKERADKERADKERAKQQQHGQAGGQTQHQKELEGKQQAKEAEKKSPYGETPKPGSLDPGRSTMANPGPQNVQIPIPVPTDDPMSTPPAAPLPNPPSRAGGDYAGDPNTSPTGEKLDPSHPDYRKDYEGQHQPDHRSAEDKKADPRK